MLDIVFISFIVYSQMLLCGMKGKEKKSTSSGQENKSAGHVIASFLKYNYQLGRLVQL